MGRCERVVAADGPQCVLMRSSNTFFGGSKFAALHMSARGTELPIPNVRSSAAIGGKADKICSTRVLRILTLLGHEVRVFVGMHATNTPNLLYSVRDP